MNITRRPAKDSDKNWVKDTHQISYRDVVTRQFNRFDPATHNGFFERAWDAHPFDILLCDERTCGYIALENKPDYIQICELVIHPDFQGQGIGTAVLRGVLEKAGSEGVSVKLNVLHQNKAAELYKRLGFRECGKNDTHILMEYKPA